MALLLLSKHLTASRPVKVLSHNVVVDVVVGRKNNVTVGQNLTDTSQYLKDTIPRHESVGLVLKIEAPVWY